MGARTRRKDGPCRQIAIRRLVNFIVETLDEETRWLVFEPNDSDTRGELERPVRGLLDRIWRQGMLDGARAEEAHSPSPGPPVHLPDRLAARRLVWQSAFRLPWIGTSAGTVYGWQYCLVPLGSVSCKINKKSHH